MQRGGKYIGKEKVYKMADEENFSVFSIVFFCMAITLGFIVEIVRMVFKKVMGK